MREKIVLLLLCLITIACQPKIAPDTATLSTDDRAGISLVPLPHSTLITGTPINIDQGLYVVPALQSSRPVTNTVNQFIENMKTMGVSTSNPSGLPISIEVANSSITRPVRDIDESYRLNIDESGIQITAANYVGVKHGLSTLTQVIHQNLESREITSLNIYDLPRYSWRGLMIDVSRHFITKDEILKNIRAMAAAKLNVLHLHLSDDQGFRVESKIWPRLHEVGSGGQYYTQQDIIEIVRFALERGIRVIPEFDMPGHVTSWLTAYPMLASVNKEYALMKQYGVHPNLLNPISDTTYAFINDLVKEMGRLFPDEYFHIGGDEVLLTQWENNKQVTDFMQANQMSSVHQVLSYFLLRVEQVVKLNKKKMIAWNESIRGQLDKQETLSQSVHSHDALFGAIRMGFTGILSAGWYLDHKLPMSELYKVDPPVDPNYIDIVPDAANWQVWDLNLDMQGTTSEGRLSLFGQGRELKGVIELMERNIVFDNATMKNGRLTFEANDGFGTMKADLGVVNNGDLDGMMSVGLFGLPIKGKKTGGSDMSNGISIPIFNTNPGLSAQQKEKIIGGEACMWSEWVDNNNVTSRIWPRSTAVAERLWSPQMISQDEQDFYRRAEHFVGYLADLGIDCSAMEQKFVNSIADRNMQPHVQTLLNNLEEVKYYERFSSAPNHSIDDPLSGLADILSSESLTSYRFGQLVGQLQKEGNSAELLASINSYLDQWKPLYRNMEHVFDYNLHLKPVQVLALALSDLSKIAGHVMNSGTLTPEESQYYVQLRSNATRRIEGVLLAPAPHLIKIIDMYMSEL